jgi:molybdate transport system substrate-binding protein
MRRVARCLAALIAAVGLLSGCGDSEDGAVPKSSGSEPPPITGTITVFAAASLQDAFTSLGEKFEAEHAGTKVVFNFGPSSGLATQIGQGAPADVFASASTTAMDEVVAGGDAAEPKDFAANTMEIAVPPDNPASVKAVADLARKGVKVALCQAAVPCGATAAKVFKSGQVTVTPVTEEIDVKAVLSKVTLGEVDAGVVYVTDVRAAGDAVKGIEIADDVNASTTYPIAALTGSENKATAEAFVGYVLSPDGAAELAAAGFRMP